MPELEQRTVAYGLFLLGTIGILMEVLASEPHVYRTVLFAVVMAVGLFGIVQRLRKHRAG
jgi:hypothetical protein